MAGTPHVSPASFLPQTSAVSTVWSSNLPSPLKPRNLQGNPLNCCLLSILVTTSFPSRINRCFLKTSAISHLPLIPLTSPFNCISLQQFITLCLPLTNVLVAFLTYPAMHKRVCLALFWQGVPNQGRSCGHLLYLSFHGSSPCWSSPCLASRRASGSSWNP